MSRKKRQRLSIRGQEAITVHGDDDIDSTNDRNTLSPKVKSIFVHSLPVETTTEGLTELFSESYPIKHATVVTDAVTKACKGYGFVTFADAEDARNAKVTFNGSELHGKKIRVDFAEPRHRVLEQEDGGTRQNALRESMNYPENKPRPQRDQKEDLKPPKLIVRNLPWSIKESEQLALLFRSFGKVKYSTIPKKASGLSAGYGFVTLRGQKNAEKAMREMNGKEIDGRQLAVDFAVEKAVWQTIQENGHSEDEASRTLEDNSSVKSEDSDKMNAYSDFESEEHYSHGSDPEEPSSDDEKADHSGKNYKSSDTTSTLFIRNVPFDATDELITKHFQCFGPVRYGRVVVDPITERSRGTAFVCFFDEEDARNCLRSAPKAQAHLNRENVAGTTVGATSSKKRSLLENTSIDSSGLYTLNNRVLQISRAVDRGEAKRLTISNNSLRDANEKDKRRLYLLSEGTIPAGSSVYNQLPPSELKLREDSAKQRQTLIKNNPALHLSLTRLSVRNIPRTMTSKGLKELARKAVVGFASDVKAGIRRPLSREELARGGEEMKQADRERKLKGKGIVRQAKIVFGGLEGSKVREDSGAGRSRGYGFIEYNTHRSALMGLRWMNGRPPEVHASSGSKQDTNLGDSRDRKKRLIIEFAIENAQVVGRRREREAKARERSRMFNKNDKRPHMRLPRVTTIKPIRRDTDFARPTSKSTAEPMSKPAATSKLAKRQQIIARKRRLRHSKRPASLS